jgi:2-polyprenyl-3-methyl-5-hydroxy-6-metoxy-1,4-benzoquinol methylase
MDQAQEFPHLERFSRDIGIAPERLVEAFRIEKEFHEKALAETDPARLTELYRDVYTKVHVLYDWSPAESGSSEFDLLVDFFKPELSGKSVLDLGCGDGLFLRRIAQTMPHKELVGIDISAPHLPENDDSVQFLLGDVVNFDPGRKFDMVVSNNVIEHIAPQQLDGHLECVKRSLSDGGAFLIITPDRVFGPSDVTRIIDFTYTNRVQAQGTHLNEMTYGELVGKLRSHGFQRFQTMLPKGRRRWPHKRIGPGLPIAIERSGPLLWLLYALQRRTGRHLSFDIILLARV